MRTSKNTYEEWERKYNTRRTCYAYLLSHRPSTPLTGAKLYWQSEQLPWNCYVKVTQLGDQPLTC